MPSTSPAAPTVSPSDRSLTRALGTWALAASIVNITIGGGIFRLPAAAASQLGSAAPIAYVVCAIAMGLIVVCFAEAGSRVSLTGGPYAYVEVAFGPFVGFLCGFLLWIIVTFALSAVSTILADSLGVLVPALSGAAMRAAALFVMYALLAFVNVRGVRDGTRLNVIVTVAKLLPLVLLVVVGAFAVRVENVAIGPAPSFVSLARASIFLVFAFAGIESALVPSGEVRDPSRTVPRAIGIAMVGVTVMYLALHLVAQGTLGATLAEQKTPLAAAAGVVLGPAGRTLMLVGAVVSTFGNVSGMTLAAPRALYALGRDGFMPAAVARIHPTYNTPHVAIWVQSALAFALALSGTFEKLAILANLTLLIVFAACAVASWELRRRDVRSDGEPFRVPTGPFIPVLSCVVIAAMLTSIHADEWAVMAGVLAAGVLLFFVTRGSRARRVAVAA